MQQNEVAFLLFGKWANCGEITQRLASFDINHHCSKCLTVYIILHRLHCTGGDELIDWWSKGSDLSSYSVAINPTNTVTTIATTCLWANYRNNKPHDGASFYCSLTSPPMINYLNLSSVQFRTIINPRRKVGWNLPIKFSVNCYCTIHLSSTTRRLISLPYSAIIAITHWHQ